MRKVILADKTVIPNCTDNTTSTEILAVRPTYGEAGAVRDLFTPENSIRIEVKNEDDETVVLNSDLVLLEGADLNETENGVICRVRTRVKTELELMHDEIAELQEVVIEG